jgi:hypothetical protein
MAAGWFTYTVLELPTPYDFVAAGIVWFIGFIWSIRWGRKVAKG